MTLINSREAWLGDVPEDWAPSRVRNIARLSPSFSDTSPTSDENCTVVPMELLSDKGVIDASNQQTFEDVQSGLSHFESGDVLFAKITPCMENGKGAFVQSLPTRYGLGSTEFHVLRPLHEVDGKFLYYYTFNPFYRAYASENMTGAAGQKRVSSRFIKDTRIFLPTLSEQRRIAAYLDASCAAIDIAVTAKRSQLKTLDALRKSIIHQAVTRGLNADVCMKPSRIDWLTEVPIHWEEKQLKRICNMIRGKFAHRPRNDPALYDGEYPFVQTGDVTAAQKYIRSYSQTLNELGLSVTRMFPKDTLVMSIAANIGDVAILDFEACFPDSMVGFIPHHKTDLDYLYYLLRAMKDIMLRSAVLTTQLNINYVRIGTNFAAFPPKNEQQAIAEFLDAKETELLAAKDILNQQIENLNSYRQSLIHECVTGKQRITERELALIQAHV